MPILPDRILADITAIAKCTETPGKGATRPTFSAAWRQARDYVASQLEAVGCNVKVDALGNLHARPSAIAWESPAWLSGSHLDSAPNTGDYDGVAGVVVALEAFRAAREDLKVALPMQLVVWAASTNFGLATVDAGAGDFVASRAFVGELDAAKLAMIKTSAGQNYLDAGAAHGVRAADIDKPAERLQRAATIGFVEVHVEQGPILWNQDCPVAVVSSIVGRRVYRCVVTGMTQHAGSTPMNDRQDALVCASEVILALEKLARDLGHGTVITTGAISARPNNAGMICGSVELLIDFRSQSTDLLARGDGVIRQTIEQQVEQRGLSHEIDVMQSQAAIEFNPEVCKKISRVAAQHCGGDALMNTFSGAEHDASVLAPHVPAAMIFVASKEGASHSPAEYSRPADLALAARVLFDTVRDRRLE